MALRKSVICPTVSSAVRTNWRSCLPQLTDGTVTLRELQTSDAASLVAHLYQPHVLRYIAPCPPTAHAFARFIRWTHAERRRGGLACFGVVPKGESDAVGIVQVWPIERDYSTAEWGFALGEAYWGSGLFTRSGHLVVDAVLNELGVYRLEARAVDANKRGNRALEKLGAAREGILRGGFRGEGEIRDHVMWSILAPDWRRLEPACDHAP